MPEPLKYMYNPQFFEAIIPFLRKHLPNFDQTDFIVRVFNNTWPDLELKERVRHITFVLHHFLPKFFPDACPILVTLAEDIRKSGLREQGFEMIFIPDYIEVFGRKFPDESLDALERITLLVSAEFAVRPFLLSYPGKTFKKMLLWSESKHPNLRRLSSEGCRPRLPWAMGIPALKNDPAPILAILEKLKNDSSEYVRRSVANNLNDIAKDHPQLVITIAEAWKGISEQTDRIIKHGCRTLLKKGDHDVLAMHGFNPASKSSIKALALAGNKIKVGENLDFGFDFVNREKAEANFRLEYAIDYITATGKRSRKIFRIAENTFLPGKKVNIRRKQSFRNLTTRKHFKGPHMLTIMANGKKMAEAEFLVC